jgi:hypothetical protein
MNGFGLGDQGQVGRCDGQGVQTVHGTEERRPSIEISKWIQEKEKDIVPLGRSKGEGQNAPLPKEQTIRLFFKALVFFHQCGRE